MVALRVPVYAALIACGAVSAGSAPTHNKYDKRAYDSSDNPARCAGNQSTTQNPSRFPFPSDKSAN